MAVNSAGDLPTLVLAYALMGLGGGLAANAAQTTALMDFHGADLPHASVIWNINRQMAFSVGAALFLMIFNLLQPHASALAAYHASFAVAALAGLLPLTCLHTLKRTRHERPEPQSRCTKHSRCACADPDRFTQRAMPPRPLSRR